MLNIIKLMILEEFRLHISYSGRKAFLSFPILLIVFCMMIGLAHRQIMDEITLAHLLLSTHGTFILFGITMGAFSFMRGELIEKRYDAHVLLVSSPAILPVRFKRYFLAYFLKEMLFYWLLLPVPLTIGLMLSSPFSGLQPAGLLFLLMTITLSFALGMSFAYFMAAVYLRSSKIFYGLLLVLGGVVLAQLGPLMLGLQPLLFDIPNSRFLYSLIPSIGLQLEWSTARDVNWQLLLAAVGVTLFGVAMATLLVREQHERSQRAAAFKLPRFMERYRFVKHRTALVAKEMLDLRRSRTIGKMVFSFVIPLLFLSFTSWFVRQSMGLPIGFNSIFYAEMIGFLSVVLYSWLNNVDSVANYASLPVAVSDVIKGKIIVYLLLSSWISSLYVIGMAIINHEVMLIPVSLPIMFIISLYVVTTTAYLTGLHTNTYLFDTSVLVRFAVFSLLPLICITIISFSLEANVWLSVGAIVFVLAILLLAAFLLYSNLDKKWDREAFVV